MVEAYVGVGSNIDPGANLPRALDILRQSVTVTAVSPVYRSAALDRPEQDDYRNAVWAIDSERDPTALCRILRDIEAALGRVRTADRWAARPIDLDLILYGDVVDPDIRTRSFVAIPLLKLAPDLVLPDCGERLADLPVAIDDSLIMDAALTATCRERMPHGQSAR